jgi:hypothetical protein
MKSPILITIVAADQAACGTETKGCTRMARPIPPDFDFRKEHIDVNEQMVRDAFQLNVDNWARLRYAINVGNDSSNLQGVSISDDVKAAYRELGKCHHEVVSSLGYCRYSLTPIPFGNLFVIQKAIKDFYFHGGALLDNLSRIIYIINIPTAASDKTKRGEYVRHAMDRGTLHRDHSAQIGPYMAHIKNRLIDEFSSTRNTIAHYWTIPFRGQNMEWPRDQLKDKALAWHYDESKYHTYSGWQPFTEIIEDHFQELVRAQDAIFGLLLNDIAKFEANNGVTIA